MNGVLGGGGEREKRVEVVSKVERGGVFFLS